MATQVWKQWMHLNIFLIFGYSGGGQLIASESSPFCREHIFRLRPNLFTSSSHFYPLEATQNTSNLFFVWELFRYCRQLSYSCRAFSSFGQNGHILSWGKSMDELTLLICDIKKWVTRPPYPSYPLTLKGPEKMRMLGLWKAGDTKWEKAVHLHFISVAPSAARATQRPEAPADSNTRCRQYMKANLGFSFSQARLGVGYMDVHIAKISLWFMKVYASYCIWYFKNTKKNVAGPNFTEATTNFLKRIHLTKSMS